MPETTTEATEGETFWTAWTMTLRRSSAMASCVSAVPCRIGRADVIVAHSARTTELVVVRKIMNLAPESWNVRKARRVHRQNL